MPWQVGGYTTEGEKPFDQGSFGTVWRARRLSDGARVALKLVLLTEPRTMRTDRIAAERHGAMLQQRFQQAHGMVPTVYDFGHDSDGHLFIAMELVEGGALADSDQERTARRHSLRPPTQSASARSWRGRTSSRQRSKANRTTGWFTRI